jgi:hypothetical protein
VGDEAFRADPAACLTQRQPATSRTSPTSSGADPAPGRADPDDHEILQGSPHEAPAPGGISVVGGRIFLGSIFGK